MAETGTESEAMSADDLACGTARHQQRQRLRAEQRDSAVVRRVLPTADVFCPRCDDFQLATYELHEKRMVLSGYKSHDRFVLTCGTCEHTWTSEALDGI